MERHDLKSWAEFIPCIRDIRDRYGTMKRDTPDGGTYSHKNHILFRGQTNYQWTLSTTLERKTQERYNVPQYINVAHHCLNQLESLTGKRWDLEAFPEIKTQIKNTQEPTRLSLPCYEYLIYLRHHGFPSPLMDWTESPYIAAYFAYFEEISVDRVAVYAFIETPNGGKLKRGGHPIITVKGPYATTHGRHFAQKAWYTLATEWKDNDHVFCPHQQVFTAADADQNTLAQDVLITITLPASERKDVLRELDDYNINHFTLFQSEDSLVKALAMKLFDIDNP